MRLDYIEKELKILDIDVEGIKKHLLRLGAKQIFSGKRYFVTYDYSDNHLIKSDVLLRITTEALNTNKAKISTHVDNTSPVRKVIKFYTDNKEKIEDMFYVLGLSEKTRVASYRDSFVWNNINFDIDQFPGIPPFIEIECDNIKENMQSIQDTLNLRGHEVVNIGTEEIYQKYGINYFERFAFDNKKVDEYWDVYDKNLKKINKVICYGQEAELTEGEYYLHIHILLANCSNDYLIIQRAWNSRHYPGEWEIIGGHVQSNESVETAIEREVKEEVGIDISKDAKIFLGKEIIGKRINLIYAIQHEFYLNDLAVEKCEIEKIRLVKAKEMLDTVSDKCGHNSSYRHLLQQGINILNNIK